MARCSALWRRFPSGLGLFRSGSPRAPWGSNGEGPLVGLEADKRSHQCVYMDVGVQEFEQHLSEYLERAAQGETIRITDRGQPKAILGPVPGSGRVALGLTESWIRAGEESKPAAVPRAKAARSIAEVLEADRNE